MESGNTAQCWGAHTVAGGHQHFLWQFWRSALCIDDSSQNLGLIEDPDAVSAVPCDSKMSCQLNGFLFQEVWCWNKLACNLSDEECLWIRFL